MPFALDFFVNLYYIRSFRVHIQSLPHNVLTSLAHWDRLKPKEPSNRDGVNAQTLGDCICAFYRSNGKRFVCGIQVFTTMKLPRNAQHLAVEFVGEHFLLSYQLLNLAFDSK
jgi:hypothetical protein